MALFQSSRLGGRGRSSRVMIKAPAPKDPADGPLSEIRPYLTTVILGTQASQRYIRPRLRAPPVVGAIGFRGISRLGGPTWQWRPG